jgi:hypothetical protein
MEVTNFTHTMGQFLSALKEVYPECRKVREYEQKFRLNSSNKTAVVWSMKIYKGVMEPWYERCAQRDASLLTENIKFLKDLDLPAKWVEMDADTRDTVWEYIEKLNHYCDGPEPRETGNIDIDNIEGMPAEMSSLLNVMPESMKLTIAATSARYATKIKNGDMSFADVNVMQMAQEMSRSINEEEMKAFSETLQSGDVNVNTSTITNMMSNMNSGEMPNGMMEAITGLLANK